MIGNRSIPHLTGCKLQHISYESSRPQVHYLPSTSTSRNRNPSKFLRVPFLPPTTRPPPAMPSKLSPSLKALLKAPHARGTALPSPSPLVLSKLFDSIAHSAAEKGVGADAWLTLSVRTIAAVRGWED